MNQAIGLLGGSPIPWKSYNWKYGLLFESKLKCTIAAGLWPLVVFAQQSWVDGIVIVLKFSTRVYMDLRRPLNVVNK